MDKYTKEKVILPKCDRSECKNKIKYISEKKEAYLCSVHEPLHPKSQKFISFTHPDTVKREIDIFKKVICNWQKYAKSNYGDQEQKEVEDILKNLDQGFCKIQNDYSNCIINKRFRELKNIEADINNLHKDLQQINLFLEYSITQVYNSASEQIKNEKSNNNESSIKFQLESLSSYSEISLSKL